MQALRQAHRYCSCRLLLLFSSFRFACFVLEPPLLLARQATTMIYCRRLDIRAITLMVLANDLPDALFLLELSQLFLGVMDAGVNGQMPG